MASRIGEVSLDDLLNNKTDLQQNTQAYYPEPTQETSGIAPAIKRSIGGGFSSLGRFAQEVGLPSQGLTNYGEELQKEAGASPVTNLADIAEHPGAAISEGLGAGIGSMVPTGIASVAGNVVGGIAGGAVGGPVGVEVGRRIGGGLARAAVNIPSYIGSNLQRQDETGEHDTGKAVLGALGQAATEELEAQAIGGLLPAGLSKKLGIDAVSKVMGEGGFSGGTVTRAVKGALTAGAANAAEEYAQQQIERAQAGLDVGSSEAIQEGAFNAALGAIAGGALGAGAGAINAKPTTNIPGSSQEFSNKEIEKNYKRLDELLAQRVEAEKTGQDTAGFDKNIDDILSHLDSSFVNPVLEDGKKPSIKPMEKQEAEAVLGFVNKIREAQKPSQEEIEVTDLTPLQKMSDEQMAIALDNAKRRLSEINAKARGEDATEVINPETGKKVKLSGKFANFLNPAEQEERSILKNIISSGNREALINWHEKMYKPSQPVMPTADGIEVTNQLPTPTEEISIPDVSAERYADQMSAPTEEIDYSNVPSPVVPEEITGKAVNPVRQSVIDKEGRQAANPAPTEEIQALPYEEREDVRAAETKAYKAKAPATRVLNKLGIQDTHEVVETAPKQFQVVRKQVAPVEQAVVPEQVEEIAKEPEVEGVRFFKNQAGPSTKNAGPEETAGLFRNQAFDIAPEVVYHASDADFSTLDPNKSKDFGIHFGSQDTVNNIAEKSGKGNIYSANLDQSNFIELPDLDSWNILDVTNALQSSEWFRNLPRNKQTYLTQRFNDLRTRYSSEARSYGVNLVALSSRYNKELTKLLSSPAIGLDGIKYKNFKEGNGEYSYLVINPEVIQNFSKNSPQFDTGISVSEITDQDMVREIMQKAFSGQKQTVDLSKFTGTQKEGMISRTLQKIEAAINKVADSVKDAGIRIEYAETTAQIPDAKIREMAQKEAANGMVVRGMFDDRSNVIYVIGNGSRSPQEAVGTLYHELVGHYGMRKILGNKFENYMERLLKSPQLTQKIYSLGKRWKSYVTDNPATKYDSFTWPGIKDENGKPVVTSRTAAIKLADEYVAELARLFTDPNIVDRYNLRTKENKSFLDKIVSFIRHLLRSAGFGSIVDEGISNQDIINELAKSNDSIFKQDSMQVNSLQKMRENPYKIYPEDSATILDLKLESIREKQIHSKQFKEWFGDWENDPSNASYVVDDDGKPLVVYHGTDTDNITVWRRFSHFGTINAANDRLLLKGNLAYPSKHSKVLFSDEAEKIGISGGVKSGANTLPVYLNIRNPLSIKDNGLGGLLDYMLEARAAGAITESEYINLRQYTDVQDRASDFIELLSSKGYDGFSYRNMTEDRGSISWIVFSPNQVKSAISNSGEFSSSSDNFMFDVAPTEDSLFNLEEQGFGKTNFDEKTSSWNKFTAWLAHKPLAKNFVHLGTLQYQNQLLRLYNKARGKTTEIEKITREIREKFEPLNKVQKMKLYEMLTTADYDQGKLVGILPNEVVSLAQQAKDKITEYGDMLVKLGKLDPLTYEQNKDRYLRTRYAKYLGESKGVGKIGSYQNYLKKKKDLTESDKAGLLEIKDPQFLLTDTLGTIGRDTALLSLLHNINYLSSKEKLGWVIDNPTLFAADGTEMTLEEAKEHLKKQRSIIKDEGDLIGYDHPQVEILVREADKLEQKIRDSYQKLDEQIAEFSQQQGMPSSMSPKEFADTYYTKLPTGKQYGKLSGMYVRKEIYDDLREGIDAFYNMNTQGKILKTMETGHRLWKTAKVSWNLPTWFQNAFGNFGLLDLASPTNMGSLAQMTAQEIHGAASGKESKYWTLGQENGVFGTTLAAQELYTNEEDFKLKLKKLGELNSGSKFAETWDQMKNMFLLFNEKTSNWYGLLEGTFKVVAIRDHIQRWEKETGQKFDKLTGNEREAVIGSAVRFANDAIFDYSAVPNWVKQIRRFPLGSPFLTFSYKALPAIMKAMRYNPKKFIKYAIMPSLMMQMFLMANPDMDEEDYEEILAKQPSYMKDKSSMFLLPWKNAEGKWEFWDAGYLLPWSPFINWGLYVQNHFDAMNYETTAQSTVDAGYELLANTFGVLGGPAPQLISVWKTGVDPFTKEAIFEEGQPASEKWWKGMTYFSNMMMPSWLSGQGFAGKLQDALGTDIGPIKAEPLNRYGTAKGTVGEAVAGLAGLKVKSVNPQESHLSNLKMYEVEEMKIKKAKTSELKNPNLDPRERLEVIKKYNALLINQRRKRSEYLKSIRPQE